MQEISYKTAEDKIFMQTSRFRSVLLVDDSYIDCLISRKVIENNNFAEKVTVVHSPVEAIAYLSQYILNREGMPEVIFLDIRMPEMTGFDFLEELRSLDGFSDLEVKIYMLSSSLDPTDLRKIKENGLVERLISKPLSNKALQEIG